MGHLGAKKEKKATRSNSPSQNKISTKGSDIPREDGSQVD